MKTQFQIGWLALLMPGLVWAHPGHDAAGLMQGLLHPWSGVDHLLAMLAVGLWAGQRMDQSRWLLPLSFVGVMLLGAVMGMGQPPIGAVEQGIAASVLVFGLLVSRAAHLPMRAGVMLTSGFALLHGYAHGVDAPGTQSLAYFAGFALSTLLLHVSGMLCARWLVARRHDQQLRWAGAAIAACGVVLLAA